MEENTVFIYSLDCPITGEIKYIGKTYNIKNRLKNHLYSKDHSKKTSWIKSLNSQNLKPVINIIDKVLEKEWEFWEQHYISLYKSWSFNLKNGTNGGEGVSKGYIPWNKNIKINSEKWLEHAKEYKHWNKGIKINSEEWLKYSKLYIPWNKGKKVPDTVKEKISKTLKGRKPWNTGTKGIKPPNSGSFKLGQSPYNSGQSIKNQEKLKPLIIPLLKKYEDKEISIKDILKILNISYTLFYKTRKSINEFSS